MKNIALLVFIGIFVIQDVLGQMPIYDRAIVAQQERMVFKQWDPDKFYPSPNRILGIPTNPNWYLTWGLHPNYPNLDKRPLSAAGEQTQRLAFAAAMNLSSNYYKNNADTVGSIAARELIRISGALSGADPLYLLYYQKELSPLDNIEANAFADVPDYIKDYVSQTGAYDWYLENMHSLSERYALAKMGDMERGQRILMYHRIMLDMRKLLNNWQYKLSLSSKMLALRESQVKGYQIRNDQNKASAKEEEIINQIIQRRMSLQ